jgi:DNA-binding CsgD family transcriptional regulator
MLSNKLDIISKQLIEKSAFIATQELLGTYETVLNCINTTTYKIILHDVEHNKPICVNNTFKNYFLLEYNHISNQNNCSFYYNNIHPNNLVILAQAIKFIQQNNSTDLHLFLTIKNNKSEWINFYSVSKVIKYTVKNKPKYLLTIFEEIDKLPKKLNTQLSTYKANISTTEQKIIRYLMQDLSTKEMADKLHVSVNTINTHRQNLIKKLEVKSSHGLVKKAMELGLTVNESYI